MASVYVLIVLLGLGFGGELIDNGASGNEIMGSLNIKLHVLFDMQERVIGLVIVGPRTSTPELITSIAAVHRKGVGMVLGNVLRSNIFNVFFTWRAIARLMKDFGTPCHKNRFATRRTINAPDALRPLRLSTKPCSSMLPQIARRRAG